MGLLTLSCAVTRELLGAVFGRGTCKTPQNNPVGVSYQQLTQLQARCLLSACAFWTTLTAVALPSLLIFGLLVIPTWIAAEIVFFAWWLLLYRRLNAQPVPHRPAQHEDPRKVFDRFVNEQAALSRYIDITDMVSRWHWNVPASQLTRGNVADLLCYGFFYRSQQQLAAEGQPDLPDQLVSEIEAAWGVRFPEGPYKPLPMMTHLWEPVRCFYRPLIFYAGVELLMLLKHVMLRAAGFKAYTMNGMRYYTYGLPVPGNTSCSATTTTSHSSTAPTSKSANCNGSSSAPEPTSAAAATAAASTASSAATAPILFLHGVGLGLLPYLNFLLRLSSLRRPVVAVEVRHLSMRVCTAVPEEDEVVATIVEALARHDVRQVHVTGHSYGTFMASRLVQLHKPMVASLTLLDPVCFVMFSGKLIYNFVYRNPSVGASLLTWFISRDLSHATSVSRRFYWSLLNLWPDQLPQHTLVALSAQDELVPVQEVLTMLESRPATRVLLHPSHRHADFIKDLPWQARMVQEVAELVHEAAMGAAADAAAKAASTSGVGGGGVEAKDAEEGRLAASHHHHHPVHHQDNSMRVQGPEDDEEVEEAQKEGKVGVDVAASATVTATITTAAAACAATGKQQCGGGDAASTDAPKPACKPACKQQQHCPAASKGRPHAHPHQHHSRSDSASSYEVVAAGVGSRAGSMGGSGVGGGPVTGGSGLFGGGIPSGKKVV
ncbi:hypothetical protein Agub_g4544 [Astrephomene gubernaculifera]|uniref:AB hydrolase-1 domain-containing protein n=1 Tax=Astrephomene gubernaculifera TaxID=47775 RepID=A0AAD3HK16_9CHLO|nr:hypothetical protein Agub_g4544 [Astrephomene gubernaculifera]